MRKLILSALGFSAAFGFAACVGDDPATIAESSKDGDGGGGANDGSANLPDGSNGDDEDATSADAPCSSGFATCGAGPACGTNLAEDAQHCGACGHSCLGGECADGKCQPELLASGFPLPVQSNIGNGLVSDDTNVYFATDRRVYKVAKTPTQDAGGAAILLHDAASSANRPRFVTLSGTTVWWTSPGTAASSGSIWRMSRDGAPGTAAAVFSTQNSPEGIGVDGTYAFWTTHGTAAQNQGVIRRHQLIGGGSTPTDVITGQTSPRHLLVGSARLYWDLAISNNNAFYTASKTPGSAPSTIVDLGGDHLAGMALTSSRLVWVTYNGEVWRASVDGTNPEKLTTRSTAGTAIAANDADLYASFQGVFGNQFKDGEVVQVLTPAGQSPTATPLATLPFVQGLAVDAEFLYVLGGDYPTTETGGKLWRIRR